LGASHRKGNGEGGKGEGINREGRDVSYPEGAYPKEDPGNPFRLRKGKDQKRKKNVGLKRIENKPILDYDNSRESSEERGGRPTKTQLFTCQERSKMEHLEHPRPLWYKSA